ncbi:MAG: UDP-N-acetylmuramoyl-L-alanyl-D-glutamate--2,6-diaminopimelate ligase [Campylobacteraceae bacterium]|jgi:UDP-N-acetylmuramoyl-L-alanyl-D-glutamate--2,6-diaminopimelate ligase|nr:UDP-N-acetylmuramoyl-L-alanyl-D-glutamate--2,6-diaminopimelate ligase [Campylobacteraceae bacterium]
MIHEVKNQKFKYITDNSNEAGENTAFVKTAQNGAYEKEAQKSGCKTLISVHECFEILGINPDLKIIGITGTNGKTTTAAAIYSMLLDLGKNAALQGTRGCFINDKCVDEKSLTTPSILHTLINMQKASQQQCSYFVMEASSHAIVQKRIEGLKFALKIFTNISQDHLDFHKSMSEYINAKSSFFSDDSSKLINKDDENIRYNLKNALTYGIEKPSTYQITAYALRGGIEMAVQYANKTHAFSSALQGKFNLYNLLAAISAVHILEKAPFEEINEALANFAGVSGRMEIVNSNPLVIVDFAHTPDGMEKVLEAMRENELVVVFGAGGDRDRLKRPLMGKIAQKYAKRLYITSDNPRSENAEDIIEDIACGMDKGLNIYKIADRKEAVIEALKSLQPKEVLMILGKGDEAYQEISGVKRPYSDKEVVQTFLKVKIDKI